MPQGFTTRGFTTRETTARGTTARGRIGMGRGAMRGGAPAWRARERLAVWRGFVVVSGGRALLLGAGASRVAWCSANRARSHARIAARSLVSGSLGLPGPWLVINTSIRGVL